MKRCPHTGLPCDCNDIEAMVNCPHNPEVPNLDEAFDQEDMDPEYEHVATASACLGAE